MRSEKSLQTFDSPNMFLQATRHLLMPHQRKLNVILPHAEKLALQERSGKPLAPQQFWIVAWSESRQVRGRSSIDYVLSCTEHHLGTYPLFLVFLQDIPSFSKQAIDSEMNTLAQYLSNTVDPRRVFSVFGQEAPVQALSKYWSEYTGHSIVPEPYYEASSSYCTRNTIVSKPESLPSGHEMRLAGQSDLPAVSQLCQEFAAESPPFILTAQRATQEAQYMIDHKLVSVYVIDGQITTIVAVTRRTENVAGMTKVYTTPRFRGRGCAEKLVAHVCERQLASGVDSVVLFVGHTLSAARVYHRVGFVGVGPGKQQHSYTPDAENWLELGFTNTDLGHW